MAIIIEDAFPGDILRCAQIACNSEIGRRYGFVQESLAARMQERLIGGDVILVARETEQAAPDIAGFAWIDLKGGFGQSPYLKLIAANPTRRSSGIGSSLLAAFEARTFGCGRAWLLLCSDFNTQAIRFYENHGYTVVGALPDFAKDGITEKILYKLQGS
jgi:ribosomal protein S18 acetylase RimI-like enzyme